MIIISNGSEKGMKYTVHTYINELRFNMLERYTPYYCDKNCKVGYECISYHYHNGISHFWVRTKKDKEHYRLSFLGKSRFSVDDSELYSTYNRPKEYENRYDVSKTHTFGTGNGRMKDFECRS